MYESKVENNGATLLKVSVPVFGHVAFLQDKLERISSVFPPLYEPSPSFLPVVDGMNPLEDSMGFFCFGGWGGGQVVLCGISA